MSESPTAITLQRCGDQHIDGLTALYNHPQVARQVLQMPFQSADLWRKRIATDNERMVFLVALHQGEVIGSCTLEQFIRVRRGHCGGIGMGVAPAWQGQGVGSRLLAAVLEVADNWMGLQRVELVFEDHLRIVKQASDQGRLAIIDDMDLSPSLVSSYCAPSSTD